MTAAEIRAEIALAERVLHDGTWNGYRLDSEIEEHWRDRLAALNGDLAEIEDETAVRFVECQYCDGLGEVQTGTATIYEPGCGYWHEDAIMSPCPECEGTGRAATHVSPVECDDDRCDDDRRPVEKEAA